MNRPLVWVALGWAAGIALGAHAGWVLLLAPPTVLLGSLLYTRGISTFAGWAVLAALFMVVGSLYGQVRGPSDAPDTLGRLAETHDGAHVTIEGVVRRNEVVLPEDDYTRFTVDVRRLQLAGGTWQTLRSGVLVRWTNPDQPVYAGERVRIEGALDRVIGPVNHRLWRQEDHWRAQGVHSTVRVRRGGVTRSGASAVSLRYWAARLRHAEAMLFARAVPESVLPFALAVWLGDRGQLDHAERQHYMLSGTAHILAVSGIHMSIVFVIAHFMLGITVSRGRLRTVLTMLIVLLFALVAGARISSVRAAVMISLYLSADLVNRESDAPTALGISGFLFLLARPMLIFDTGFLLSFSCVASLLLFAGPIEQRLRFLPMPVRRAAAACIAVQLLPLPLSVHFFHFLPLAAPLVNLLIVPLLSLVLWGCFLTLAAGMIAAGLATIMGHALLPIIGVIRGLAAAVAHSPIAQSGVTSPTLLAAAFFWAALALLYTVLRGGPLTRRRLLAVAGLLLCAALFWRPLRPGPMVAFLDVGQADAAFFRTPGGDTALIDGGARSPYADAGDYVVAPFLLAHHVGRLDYIVATHPERDHIGGLFSVIERIPVGTLLISASTKDAEREKALLAHCAAHGVPVRRVGRGDRIPLAGAQMTVLHPPPGWREGENVNDYSLAFRLAWPGMRVLFAGDIEKPAERSMLGQDLRADVLKVPHHGSHTSSTAAFLDAVAPRHAVASTQRIHPDVARRYTAHGIHLWRTDWHGGLILRQHGAGLLFDGARIRRGYRSTP
ncbi:MAG: DNA internalization-related competence protein ComEC/Rec2 [Candidatus Hydrogenedentota bacterium]